MLEKVKELIGITGFQDDTVQGWIDETIEFLKDAGVSEGKITSGVVARGVLDLWNLGAGDGKFSEYFIQRTIQLAYK